MKNTAKERSTQRRIPLRPPFLCGARTPNGLDIPMSATKKLVICAVLWAASAVPRNVTAANPPVAGAVVVQPATIQLRHPRQPQSLQVLGKTADGYTLDLRSQARFASANPQVAAVDERGWIRPVANGQTQVTVEVAG